MWPVGGKGKGKCKMCKGFCTRKRKKKSERWRKTNQNDKNQRKKLPKKSVIFFFVWKGNPVLNLIGWLDCG